MIHNKKNIGIQMLESPFLIATYFVEEVQSKTDTISPKYMQKSEDSWRLTALYVLISKRFQLSTDIHNSKLGANYSHLSIEK